MKSFQKRFDFSSGLGGLFGFGLVLHRIIKAIFRWTDWIGLDWMDGWMDGWICLRPLLPCDAKNMVAKLKTPDIWFEELQHCQSYMKV